MKVFICWSGQRSRYIAEAFRWWLPLCIQSAEPWLSESDLEKGRRWDSEISKQLAEANFGLICLTPENQKEQWIHFEAGALSKLDKAYLWTFLFELKPAEISGPLSSFQHTQNTKDDIRKLVQTINSCAEKKLSDKQVEDLYDNWWPKLEERLGKVPPPKNTPPKRRPTDEMIEEILELVRKIANKSEVDDSTWQDLLNVERGQTGANVLFAELLRNWKPPSLRKQKEKEEK